jgi:potassium efflux system protein
LAICLLAVTTVVLADPQALADEGGGKNGDAPTPQSLSLSAEQIKQRIAAIQQDAALTAEQKTPLVETYQAALNDLAAANELNGRLKQLVKETENAKAAAESIRGKLKSLASEPPSIEADVPLVELEQQLTQLELQSANLKQTRQAGQAELQTRSQRRKEIRNRLVALQQRLAEPENQPAGEAAAEAAPLSTAEALQRAAGRLAMQRETQVLEAELAKYDADETFGLIQLRSDLLAKQIGHTERTIEALQARIKHARELAAAESVRKAKLEAIDADPALKAYAQRNQDLAERAKRVADSLAHAEADLKAATEAHEQLSGQFKQTRTKVETVGLTSSVGALLRKQRTNLPDVRQRKEAVAARQTLINDAQYELFEYDDERHAIADNETMIAEMIQHARHDRSEALLRSAATELLVRKKEYLDALIRTSNQYFDTLIELDTIERQLIALTADYENYIDQRVLWIRSARLLTSDFSLDTADTDLVRADRWAALGVQLGRDAVHRLPVYLLVGLAAATLLIRRRKMRERIRDAGVAAAKGNCRSFSPTVLTLLVTVLISLGLPLLCLFFAWRLTRFPVESDFAGAVSQGLFGVGVIWASSELLRQLCRPQGLAEAHFGWPRSITATARREIRRMQMLALPVVFVTAALSASDSSHGRNAAERVAYVLGMGLLAVFLGRLFGPEGLLRDTIAARQTGWFGKLKYVWMLLAISVPTTLATLAFLGYYYTARVLFWRVFATAMFITALIVVRSLLFRMLLLRRRSISIEQARQRASAAASAGGDHETAGPVAGIVTTSPETDIGTQSLQSRKLVNTALFAASVIGLWFIWVQVLPALGMLDKYELWGGSTVQVATANTATAAPVVAGAATADSRDADIDTSTAVSQVVTASDLALAILIVVVTFVVARNGPGLLEISVLQQLPVDASVRYAITTLVSYAIILAGVIATCSTIGLQWSQIQWLATALTFGLAFGLQEMFANFVAGLIILLERPIRVGDIVTVDDVTGVVSRIRIRATSITNWDRKEYVVPNKEFITGRLLNWTLSDNINRVVVNVGVAYGSDTDKAREILLSCAREHPLILEDPTPIATFEGFGDNSLNLVLRAYLPSLDNRLEVIHQLHTAIDKAFRQERIDIAFPQRDLHIRSLPAELGAAFGVEAKLRESAENRNAA